MRFPKKGFSSERELMLRKRKGIYMVTRRKEDEGTWRKLTEKKPNGFNFLKEEDTNLSAVTDLKVT